MINWEGVRNWFVLLCFVAGALCFRRWLDLCYRRKYKITGAKMSAIMRRMLTGVTPQ